MSNDKKADNPPISIVGAKPVANDRHPPNQMGIINPNFKPKCGHDHSDGSNCNGHHDHNHHHDDKKPSDYNNGFLSRIYKGPANAEEVLNNARSTILLTGAAGLTQIDTSGSLAAMAGMMGFSFILANEASEELMESVQYVRNKLNISGGSIGMILSGAHVATEGVMAVAAKYSETFNHASEYVVQVTMSNNLMHATAMTGVAGLAGALCLDKPQHRKMNIAAMIVSSGALGLQAATNESSPLLSGIGIGTAVGYAVWRIRAGIGCSLHGDLCGHAHEGPKDETDYISFEYMRLIADKIKNIKPDQYFHKLTKDARKAKDKIADATLPSPKSLRTTMTAIAPPALSFGAMVLAAHTMTDNAVSIASHGGLGASELALITAAGLAAPELIASTKAAVKRDSELAAAMIIGCTVLGTGFVGGMHGALGNMSGDIIKDGWNGMVHMSGLLAPIGIYAAATRENWAKKLAHLENKTADWLDRQNLGERVGRVSNWLRQSVDSIEQGKIRLSKIAATGMLASMLAYSAAIVTVDSGDGHTHSHHHKSAVGQTLDAPDIDFNQDFDYMPTIETTSDVAPEVEPLDI